MKENFPYFRNEKCKYFPCHQTSDKDFNCFFCYCPLYALGSRCGGNYVYIEGGIKDCSACTIPHSDEGQIHIKSKLREVSELAKKNR